MVDFFRKIPTDLTETTVVCIFIIDDNLSSPQVGAGLSAAACLFMLTLFAVELRAFIASNIDTGVMLDTNAETLFISSRAYSVSTRSLGKGVG